MNQIEGFPHSLIHVSCSVFIELKTSATAAKGTATTRMSRAATTTASWGWRFRDTTSRDKGVR